MQVCYKAGRILIQTSFLLLILLFILPNINAHSLSAQVDPALSKALQRVLDSLQAKSKITGVSAAILMPDGNEWVGTSGMSNPDTKDTLTTDMLLSMGSITKTFTGAIIMQLASENKLSLEDSIYKWIPKHLNIDSTITIRQLLNHTSGLYNYTNNDELWNQTNLNYSRRFSTEEILSFVKSPSFKAGTGWEYSNTNFILLGMIIKKITGSEISAELHKRLLKPFNLSNTFLDVEDTIKIKIADGWSELNSDSKLENLEAYSRTAIYSGAWTAGAMVSNPADLARWVKYLYSGEVVEKKYLDQMLNFTALSGNAYGLATIKTLILQRTFWGHSGGIPGYSSYAGYTKQGNISIAVQYNQDNGDIFPFLTGLVKTAVNYKPTSIKEDISSQPGKFHMEQNYPNPFNPETVISYQLPVISNVKLKVYDMLGREVTTLVDKEQKPGNYIVKFNGSNLASGIYLYTIRTSVSSLKFGNFTQTRKMILMK